MIPVFGHEAQAKALLAAAHGGRMHHGWILAGPPGIGKARFARALALRLLAEAAGPPPEEEGLAITADHPIAKIFSADAHPDYAELRCLEKDSGTARNISVDQVRGLGRLIQSVPSLSDRRVVVIDSADDLERGAANALLKTLEEPPAGMLFLLVSHAPGRLLPTIRSRCRTLRFDPLGDADMRAALRAQDADLPSDEIEALVAIGEGSPGKALRFAGLAVADLDRMMRSIASDGDPGNANRLMLVKMLSGKPAKGRYEAFLERAPAFIAAAARQRQGRALGDALDRWEAARQLAGGALILSLDPGAVVFELGTHIASLAPKSA